MFGFIRRTPMGVPEHSKMKLSHGTSDATLLRHVWLPRIFGALQTVCIAASASFVGAVVIVLVLGGVSSIVTSGWLIGIGPIVGIPAALLASFICTVIHCTKTTSRIIAPAVLSILTSVFVIGYAALVLSLG